MSVAVCAAKIGFEQRKHISIVPFTRRSRQERVDSRSKSVPASARGQSTQPAGTHKPNGIVSEISTSPSPPLSIVFTDVVKSTLIWERNAMAMQAAMQIHDNILRTAMARYQGYEVKQNGDGFMIAFPATNLALRFCVDVQIELMHAEWPEALLKLGPGKEVKEGEKSPTSDSSLCSDSGSISSSDFKRDSTSEETENPSQSNIGSDSTRAIDNKTERDGEDGNVLFRGLRLRMTAHYGEPVCQYNQVIERMDYLGPMVNRTARFVQVTEGGQIVVSEDFLKNLFETRGESQILEKFGSPRSSPSKTTSSFPSLPFPSFFSSATKKDQKEQDASKDEDESASSDRQLLPSQTFTLSSCFADENGSRGKGERGETKAGTETDIECRLTLLGKHRFSGLDELMLLYFIIPTSLEGRMELWPKQKYVAGSKGNVISE